MKVIMQLAQKIFCVARQLLAEGNPDQIKNDKRVIDAYLGVNNGRSIFSIRQNQLNQI